jgi:hypothetical protein
MHGRQSTDRNRPGLWLVFGKTSLTCCTHQALPCLSSEVHSDCVVHFWALTIHKPPAQQVHNGFKQPLGKAHGGLEQPPSSGY